MKSQNAKKLRIGDVAEQLEVKEFVIRFWEREFKIKARRSAGGQRFYTKQHVSLLQQIKDLLYAKEYTIAGAKKYLEEQRYVSSMQVSAKQLDSQKILVTAAKRDMSTQHSDSQDSIVQPLEPMVMQQLVHVRATLIRLKELL
jgi:DNA-binding transcriptional MerR regulator